MPRVSSIARKINLVFLCFIFGASVLLRVWFCPVLDFQTKGGHQGKIHSPNIWTEMD